MKKLFRDLFFGTTNRHWDLARVLTGLFSLALIAGVIFSIYKGGDFEAVDFAQAAGMILAAGGLSIAAKDIARPRGLRDNETVSD